METKVCSKCKEPKLLEEFGKKLDGRTSMCLECTRKQNRKYYKDNKETIRKRQNAAYPKHADKQKAQQKQFLKDNQEHGLLKLARQRCKKSGVLCTIAVQDIVIPEFCPIIGVKLEFGDMATRDNSPSLDRIIPELGYVPGNIAVISYRANRIKNEGSSDEHRRIADWMDSQKVNPVDLAIKNIDAFNEGKISAEELWSPESTPSKDIHPLSYLEPYWGKFVTDGRVPKGEIRMGSWAGPTLMKNIGTNLHTI